MLNTEEKQLCRLFADVIDYPRLTLHGTAENCVDLLEEVVPGVSGRMKSFSQFVKGQTLASLEELYTQTFDIAPSTSFYLGYHLFGETPKRSEFFIRLTDAYQACSFSTGIELPDHLGVILRFLSVCEDRDFALPLLDECTLPVLTRIETELKKMDNPYTMVVGPLTAFLRHVSHDLARTGGPAHA